MSAAALEADGTLFSHEVRRDGRPVVTLRAVRDGAGVVVHAEIVPVTGPPEAEPVRRPFAFPSREVAQRFADETLHALLHLGCDVSR